MIYEINTDTENIVYQKLYDDFFPEKATEMNKLKTDNKLIYNICAIENNKTVGVMGITLQDKDYYRFLHLVVDSNYTGQGVATGIIRMAVKFLIEKGASKIRNHKRENIIPHTTFTDMGFDLIRYDPDYPNEYKWVYELDINKADMNKLNNIWSQYNEQTNSNNNRFNRSL
jgi:GNAT superfamily N-acetyltransferase